MPPANIHSMRSLHLCGSVINRYLKQESDVIELCAPATRIQLNLNINNYTEDEYEKLAEDIDAAKQLAKSIPSVLLTAKVIGLPKRRNFFAMR